ncbi:MAG: hypothetical protein ABSF83_01840 [Nitrososphaerales archaeon]|jgi:predicted nuclease with TOPRIM domain
METIETTTSFADTKNQLEGRIRHLEEQRAALQGDIESLNETITIKTLERNASSLENQVQSLRIEKIALEDRVGHLSSDAELCTPQSN